MNPARKAVPALIAGTLLAFGAAGCANWHANTADKTAANGTRAHAAAASTEGPRTPGEVARDASITGRVKAALAADELVKARHIDVDTLRGVVQLNGTVSAAEKDRALQVARRVEGVHDVRDNLKTSG